MSDYLDNLLARELGRLETVEPRRPSRFEPPAAASTFPSGARTFGDAPEHGDPFRTETTETFADPSDATPPLSSSSAPRPAPFLPSRDAPLTPPNFTREERRHARPSSMFGPESAEPSSPFDPTRSQPFDVHDEETDSSSPSSSPTPTPTPTLEPASTPARRTATDETRETERTQQARTAPLAEREAAPSQVEPSITSPLRLESDEARPRGAEGRDAATPRETLLIPLLDAREVLNRDASANEAGERAAHFEASPVSPTAKPPARADDESSAKRASVEPSTAHRERRESSEAEARRERRERQPASPSSLVQPRAARRAEAQQQQRQADAQTEAEAAPIINVTIGRIEIRATSPAPRRPPHREPTGASPMSLEDYLRRRGGGGGR